MNCILSVYQLASFAMQQEKGVASGKCPYMVYALCTKEITWVSQVSRCSSNGWHASNLLLARSSAWGVACVILPAS